MQYKRRNNNRTFSKTENTYENGNFTVKLRKDENSESLIKRHMKKLKKEKLLEEVYERSFFKKPTTKRRESFFKSKLVLKKLRDKERLSMESDE